MMVSIDLIFAWLGFFMLKLTFGKEERR